MSDQDENYATASLLSICQKCGRPRARRRTILNSRQNPTTFTSWYCSNCYRLELSRQSSATNSSGYNTASGTSSLEPDITSPLTTEETDTTASEELASLCSSISLHSSTDQRRVPPILQPFIPSEIRSNSPVPSQHSMPIPCYAVLSSCGATQCAQLQQWRLYFLPYSEMAYRKVSRMLHTNSERTPGGITETPQCGHPWPWVQAGGDGEESSEDYFRWKIELPGDFFTIDLEVDPCHCIFRILSTQVRVFRDQLDYPPPASLRLSRYTLPCFEFELNPIRGISSTTFKVTIMTDCGKVSWRKYPIYSSWLQPPRTEMPERDRKILRNSRDIIGDRLHGVRDICLILCQTEVLAHLDMVNILRSREQVGELLSVLPHRGDVLDCFIKALNETRHQDNTNLATILSIQRDQRH